MGSITAFSAGSNSTVSANQFNQTALDAAIQSACPAGDTCSGSTLTEIDFSLQVNLSASVGVLNSNSTTSYIGPYTGTPGGNPGTFAGGGGSGTAIAEVATIDLTDGITGGIDVEDIPTFSVATTSQFKTSCGGTGTATSGHFINCLGVASGSHTYSGTGTDTETGSYTGDLSGETSTYVGPGLVTFTLASSGTENNGALTSGVTIPTNSAGVTALSNALVVTYDYSYTETAAAPEPTTMVLVGGALLAIGIIRKKRIS
jgi:hypothetical protein